MAILTPFPCTRNLDTPISVHWRLGVAQSLMRVARIEVLAAPIGKRGSKLVEKIPPKSGSPVLFLALFGASFHVLGSNTSTTRARDQAIHPEVVDGLGCGRYSRSESEGECLDQ